MRPHHYVKNLFVFVPLFFAGKIFQLSLLFDTLIVAILFSVISSSIYIFNDFMDRNEDANHPLKSLRPIASGSVKTRPALVFGLCLAIVGIGGALFTSVEVAIIIISYFILNLTYSVKLKHVAIIDTTVISLGFVLRLFVGAAAASISLSMWIILLTFILALFLSVAKRRDDVLIYIKKGEKLRSSVDGYNIMFINITMAILGSLVIVFYVMYVSSSDVISQWGTDKLYFSTIFILMGVLRYLQLTFVESNSGNPTRVFFEDNFIKICVLGFAIFYFVLIYATTGD